MARSAQVFIVGDAPLVEEYSALCLDRGVSVFAKTNSGERASLPKGVRTSARGPKRPSIVLELTNISTDLKRRNLRFLDRSTPTGIPIISSSVTITVAEQSTWIDKAERLIGVGALPSLLEGQLIELAPSSRTDEQTVDRARRFVASLGKEAAIVHDSVGLVMPRILCMLANEAYFAVMESVAEGADIDTAMKLGTNHPAGPVERARKIGIKQVFSVLSALHQHFGEDRYRVAPLLRVAAL